jgi:hypothetical protein
MPIMMIMIVLPSRGDPINKPKTPLISLLVVYHHHPAFDFTERGNRDRASLLLPLIGL